MNYKQVVTVVKKKSKTISAYFSVSISFSESSEEGANTEMIAAAGHL